MQNNKPDIRPARPQFSSGPCQKYPNFALNRLDGALLGRSHRSSPGKAKLKKVIAETKSILGIPDDYMVAIVPASDTGAVEMAMWNLLGGRPVTMVAWEVFGFNWITDAQEQLGLDAEHATVPFGEVVDMASLDYDRDVVFTWNGTTSGVRVPDGTKIPENRQGLTICDATSAAFAMDLPWTQLDATTFSWQKVLGGEAAHGMLILSPRAVARLEQYTPPWPLPKIFRLKKEGQLIKGIFEGETINTPSMLAVEDVLQALAWAKSVGGLEGLIARTEANAKIVWDFCETRPWLANLARDPATRSTTSVCLTYDDPDIDHHRRFAAGVAKRLEDEGIAYDINAYRDAPPGLRIWCGATINADDISALMPWIEWAYRAEKSR